jgi:hypothetical protein
MSKATSIRGTRYEENFRQAFVHQNAEFMKDGKFELEKEEIYEKGKNQKIGDIDGYYISSKETNLNKLFPGRHRLSDIDFVINEGDHVFFELTTQSGDDLWKTPAKYIEKKLKFHKQLVTGGANNLQVEQEKHVLVFCFNGADNVKVADTFTCLNSQFKIRGTTVYLASDVVDQWDLELTLAEQQQVIAEKQQVIAEKQQVIDNLKEQLAKIQQPEIEDEGLQRGRKKAKIETSRESAIDDA